MGIKEERDEIRSEIWTDPCSSARSLGIRLNVHYYKSISRPRSLDSLLAQSDPNWGYVVFCFMNICDYNTIYKII